jgi:hypothetical protein
MYDPITTNCAYQEECIRAMVHYLVTLARRPRGPHLIVMRQRINQAELARFRNLRLILDDHPEEIAGAEREHHERMMSLIDQVSTHLGLDPETSRTLLTSD